MHSRSRSVSGFTLLEIALVVGIIGMMLLMVVGYLMAPKHGVMDPHTPPATPIPSQVPAPTPHTETIPSLMPAATPSASAPSTPAPAPATQTIDLSTPPAKLIP